MRHYVQYHTDELQTDETLDLTKKHSCSSAASSDNFDNRLIEES